MQHQINGIALPNEQGFLRVWRSVYSSAFKRSNG